MQVADRLDLLSFLAILWIAVTILVTILGVIESVLYPSEPGPVDGPGVYIGPLGLIILPGLICFWFGSWGLISLAAFGSETHIFGGQLETTRRDTVTFFVSPIAWHIALGVATFQSSAAMLIVLAVLPVAILIGIIVLLWRLFTGGVQSMTMGIIQRGPRKAL
jgi:hypothetical protein